MKLTILAVFLIIAWGVDAAQYIEKRNTVGAIQWDATNLAAVQAFMSPDVPHAVDPARPNAAELIAIETVDGRQTVRKGEWIVKDAGDYTVFKTKEFNRKYELVVP